MHFGVVRQQEFQQETLCSNKSKVNETDTQLDAISVPPRSKSDSTGLSSGSPKLQSRFPMLYHSAKITHREIEVIIEISFLNVL